MSGNEHPGVKLHAVFNGHYWDVAVGPKDYSQGVGSCFPNAALGYGPDGAERYARLFAAAPDLLEVCQALVSSPLTNTNALLEAKRLAEAAISRATEAPAMPAPPAQGEGG